MHLLMSSDWIFVIINFNAYGNSLRRTLIQSSALYYFFEYGNYFFIDKSKAAHLCVGCAKTVTIIGRSLYR